MVTYEELEKCWQKKSCHWCRQPSLTFADEGVLLGSDCVICKSGDRTARGMTLQIDGNEDRILALLSLAYGRLILPDVIKNFRNASRWLAQGEKCLAYIHLAFAGLPRINGDERQLKFLYQAGQLLDEGQDASELLKTFNLLPESVSAWQWAKYVKTVASCQGEARDGHGRWTDSGGQAPVSGSGKDPTVEKKEKFVDRFYQDAQKAADELRVPVENVLGLCALESGWGGVDPKARFAREGNNFFSQYHPAPYETGWMWNDDQTVKMATFASISDSVQSFVVQYGDIVKGASDPEKFASALQNAGKYGIDPDDGSKVKGFVSDVASTIRNLRPAIKRRVRSL